MNKAQRVKAVMNREETDYIPAGFWFHYKPDFTVEEMIGEHLKLYRETDMDVIKIMQDYAYPVTGEIHCADDWFHIGIKGTDSKELKKMTEVIRGIREQAGDDVLLFQTMFGPFKAASIAFGDDVLMKYSKEAPEAVRAGIQKLADAFGYIAKFLEPTDHERNLIEHCHTLFCGHSVKCGGVFYKVRTAVIQILQQYSFFFCKPCFGVIIVCTGKQVIAYRHTALLSL